MQTRSAHIRLSLQLWDTVSGELIWSSAAETAVESEAITQDPIFIEDVFPSHARWYAKGTLRIRKFHQNIHA